MTKHLICVVVGGEYVVACEGMYDGQPNGQGIELLEFLAIDFDRTLFLSKLPLLTITDKRHRRNTFDQYVTRYGMSTAFIKFKQNYPTLNDQHAVSVLESIQKITTRTAIVNNLEYAGEDSDCEWIYVVDLDSNVFEVYNRVQMDTLYDSSRFLFLLNSTSGQSPIKLVWQSPLDSLPNRIEFLRRVDYCHDEYISPH